jgi:hypothetical protein
MEEPGRDEPPILARPDVRRVLCAHVYQGLWEKRIERPLVSLAVDDEFEKEECKDDDAGHIGSRHGREPHLSAPQVDGTGTQLRLAVRADAIACTDKGPAIRAHTALFHRSIVATGKGPA